MFQSRLFVGALVALSLSGASIASAHPFRVGVRPGQPGKSHRGSALQLVASFDIPAKTVIDASTKAEVVLRPVAGQVSAPNARSAEAGSDSLSRGAIIISIASSKLVPGTTLEIPFQFIPSGKNGAGVHAELRVFGPEGGTIRSGLAFGVDRDNVVRPSSVGDINQAQHQVLVGDPAVTQRRLRATRSLPLSSSALERALKKDSDRRGVEQ